MKAIKVEDVLSEIGSDVATLQLVVEVARIFARRRERAKSSRVR